MNKRVPKILLVLTLLSIFSVSCSSDDGTSADNSSFMSATIGDTDWQSTQINFSNLTVVNGQGQRYDVSAGNQDIEFVLAVVDRNLGDCITPGIYGGDDVLFIYYYNLDGTFVSEHFPTPLSDNTIESNLQVTVTSCADGKISGTFSGTMYSNFFDQSQQENDYETLEISNGRFQNIPFQVINQGRSSVLSTSPENNTF
ncbi:hypothetical protein [Aquimarina sp. SS2-1]|uniref:hypothetical protein n=1 Tax=Aquimarina besae TaxID=3342247 RepID=UPI00366D3397